MVTQETLRQRYCPPLDEALLFAVASDYDLQNDNQREQLEQELDALKTSAIIEQELELAPSIHDGAASNIQNLAADPSQQKTRSDEDNGASLTSGLSRLTTSEQESNTDYTDFSLPSGLENASATDKEQWLKTLFPTIESVQISETLKKCNSDMQHSIDELLNLSFINDDIDQKLMSPPPVPKGIDGFLGEGNKKSKAKRKRHKQFDDDFYTSDSGISSGAMTPNTNVWDKANEDVAFIVSRTGLSTATVNSIYHQNNANLSKTIRSLVQAEAKQQSAVIEQNEILQMQAQELQMEIQGVSENYIFGALLLAQMLPSAAKDLIDKMNERPMAFELPKGKVVGLAQYAPVKLDGEDTKKENRLPRQVLVDTSLLMDQAGVHSVRADTAFNQASAAYRRGKSDKLMGGAAAYYSQIGREENRRRKELLNSAADAHVYQQSDAGNVCDLHGVTVEHAVRIARDKVEQWWEDLGDAKYRGDGREIGDGYRIITGVGTHSAQRIGKIGPAVSRMLMREGWKVNIQRGEVFVEGRVRRGG